MNSEEATSLDDSCASQIYFVTRLDNSDDQSIMEQSMPNKTCEYEQIKSRGRFIPGRNRNRYLTEYNH
jgi:hypothetical protein